MKYANVRHMSGIPAQSKRVIALVTFLLLITSGLRAQLPGVKITLDLSGVPVEEVLDHISDQSGYFFTYNTKLFPAKNKVSFKVKGMLIDQALDSLLRDRSLTYKLIDRNIVIYRKGIPGAQVASTDSLTSRKITGRIIDDRSGKPLPFATIALLETNKGTISNEAGEFTLNVPGNISDAVLSVSYIGYRNQYRVVTLPSTTGIIINLVKDVISLQEVIIRYQDPAELLDEAISKIPENYLARNSLMTAYYRENVRRNKKVLLFSEAVLDIFKYSYEGSTPNDRVKIIKGRKFMDVANEDTVLLKIKSGIRSSLQLDIIKSLPYFLTKENHHLFNYEFADIVSYKNHMVYVIHFRQKPQIREALFTGDLYIDMENLAILAADFQLDPRYIGQETNTFVIKKSPRLKIKPLSAVYHVEYRKSDNKYHISQVRGEVRFKMRKKRKWIASSYALNIEMAITDVQPGSAERFRNNETINPGIILSDQVFVPDNTFWGDYNTIEPEASLTEVLKKMGRQVPWSDREEDKEDE